MPRPQPKGPGYSCEREFKVILEDLESQFKVFGEGLQAVREDVSQLKTDMADVKEDVGQLKIHMSFVLKALPTVATKDDLRQFDKRLTVLEAAR